jgi:signal transduction histidine kinase
MPAICANGPLLHQALSNLIDNALKFVAPGKPPRVRCRAERRGEVVRLWVEDEGLGIQEEHSANIFKPFVRLHGDSQYHGTGMGLAIVQRAVERMNGRIGVESTPGKGSQFWVEFRAADGE